MSRPTGIDQSWGYVQPKTLAAMGVQAVAMYLSWDTTKNMTVKKALSYFDVGIDVVFNWESQAGAPLHGWRQGHVDAVEACKQAKGIMLAAKVWPVRRPVIYFSCDTDADPAAVEAYYAATNRVTHDNGFGNGVYGSARVVEHLAAKKLTDAEWQTYAWSRGVLSPVADFYQYRNGQRIDGQPVDFDRVIHFDQLGSWGPNAYRREHPKPHPRPTAPPPPPVTQRGDDDVATLYFQQSRKMWAVLVDGTTKVTVQSAASRQALKDAGVRCVTLADEDYARIRKGADQ